MAFLFNPCQPCCGIGTACCPSLPSNLCLNISGTNFPFDDQNLLLSYRSGQYYGPGWFWSQNYSCGTRYYTALSCQGDGPEHFRLFHSDGANTGIEPIEGYQCNPVAFTYNIGPYSSGTFPDIHLYYATGVVSEGLCNAGEPCCPLPDALCAMDKYLNITTASMDWNEEVSGWSGIVNGETVVVKCTVGPYVGGVWSYINSSGEWFLNKGNLNLPGFSTNPGSPTLDESDPFHTRSCYCQPAIIPFSAGGDRFYLVECPDINGTWIAAHTTSIPKSLTATITLALTTEGNCCFSGLTIPLSYTTKLINDNDLGSIGWGDFTSWSGVEGWKGSLDIVDPNDQCYDQTVTVFLKARFNYWSTPSLVWSTSPCEGPQIFIGLASLSGIPTIYYHGYGPNLFFFDENEREFSYDPVYIRQRFIGLPTCSTSSFPFSRDNIYDIEVSE